MFEPTTQTRRKSHTPKHAHTSTHTHSVTHGYTHHHTCSSRMRLYDRSRYVRFPNRSRFSMRDILFLSSRRKVRLRRAAKSGEMDGIALPCRCKCSSSFSLAVHAAQNAMHKQGKGEERKGRAHALLEAVRRGQLVPIRFQFLQLLQAVQPVDRLQHIPGQIQTAQLRVLAKGRREEGQGLPRAGNSNKRSHVVHVTVARPSTLQKPWPWRSNENSLLPSCAARMACGEDAHAGGCRRACDSCGSRGHCYHRVRAHACPRPAVILPWLWCSWHG